MSNVFGYNAKLEKAIAFQWEVQRLLHQARHEGWSAQRLKERMNDRKKMWREFPAGIRDSANAVFKEELNDELAKPAHQRNPHRPVWLNEQIGIGTEFDTTGANGGAGPATASPILAPSTR